MRKQHYLRQLKPTKMPKRIIVFHADAIIDKPTVDRPRPVAKLGGVDMIELCLEDGQYRETDKGFACNAEQFWYGMRNAMLAKQTIFAFGLGTAFQLSLLGFWDLLESKQWSIGHEESKETELRGGKLPRPRKGMVVLSDPPTIVVSWPVGFSGSVKWLDLRNYGVDRIPDHKPDSTPCEAIANWIRCFCHAIMSGNHGGLQPTAASQAMRSFRSRQSRQPIYCHGDPTALELERESLAGGRCECFRLGMIRQKVFHLDFTAHYPAIAAFEPVPTKLTQVYSPSVSTLKDDLESGDCVTADVILETPAPWYPIKQDERVIFPIGRFRAVLATPEVLFALSYGHIVRVNKVCRYTSAAVFTRYISELLALRLWAKSEKKRELEACCKMICNSLFGKFAQRSWQWQDVPDKESPRPYKQWWQRDPETRLLLQWRSLAWRVQRSTPPEEGRESCPAITSHINSAGRVKLLRAMMGAGLPNVYYVDTDSVWTNGAGHSALSRGQWISDGEPGFLKLVGEYPWLRLLGIKHYETPTKHVHSGVPGHAIEVGQRKYTWDSIERLSGSLARGCAPTGMVLNKVVSYTSPYRNGVVSKTGRVSPYTLYTNEDKQNGRTSDDDNCFNPRVYSGEQA
jgi:DNA polymerase type B, organellar and viral